MMYRLKPGLKHHMWKEGNQWLITEKDIVEFVPKAFKDKFELVGETVAEEEVIEEEVIEEETSDNEVSVVKEGRKWTIYQGLELLTEDGFKTKREATEWLENNGY